MGLDILLWIARLWGRELTTCANYSGPCKGPPTTLYVYVLLVVQKYCCMASFFSFTVLFTLVQEVSGGARTHLGAPHTHFGCMYKMGPKCLWSHVFFFQFCDVAEVVIIHKMV
jgi:hypothetical protein